jgi:hypothetical protein
MPRIAWLRCMCGEVGRQQSPGRPTCALTAGARRTAAACSFSRSLAVGDCVSGPAMKLQSCIWRLLDFVSVRTIKGRSIEAEYFPALQRLHKEDPADAEDEPAGHS